MKDARTHPRVAEKDIVTVTILSAPLCRGLTNKTFFSSTENISAGGLNFSVQTPPPVGAVLKISVAFASPTRSVKNITGRVAWVKKLNKNQPHTVGVDFIAMPGSRLEAWREIIREKLSS